VAAGSIYSGGAGDIYSGKLNALMAAIGNMKSFSLLRMDDSACDYELKSDALLVLTDPIENANEKRIATNGHKLLYINFSNDTSYAFIDDNFNYFFPGSIGLHAGGEMKLPLGVIGNKNSQLALEAYNYWEDTIEMKCGTRFAAYAFNRYSLDSVAVVCDCEATLLVANAKTTGAAVRWRGNTILAMKPGTVAIVHFSYGESSILFYSGDADERKPIALISRGDSFRLGNSGEELKGVYELVCSNSYPQLDVSIRVDAIPESEPFIIINITAALGGTWGEIEARIYKNYLENSLERSSLIASDKLFPGSTSSFIVYRDGTARKRHPSLAGTVPGAPLDLAKTNFTNFRFSFDTGNYLVGLQPSEVIDLTALSGGYSDRVHIGKCYSFMLRKAYNPQSLHCLKFYKYEGYENGYVYRAPTVFSVPAFCLTSITLKLVELSEVGAVPCFQIIGLSV